MWNPAFTEQLLHAMPSPVLRVPESVYTSILLLFYSKGNWTWDESNDFLVFKIYINYVYGSVLGHMLLSKGAHRAQKIRTELRSPGRAAHTLDSWASSAVLLQDFRPGGHCPGFTSTYCSLLCLHYWLWERAQFWISGKGSEQLRDGLLSLPYCLSVGTPAGRAPILPKEPRLWGSATEGPFTILNI